MRLSLAFHKTMAGGILLALVALSCYFDEKPTASNPNNPNNSRATLSRISVVYDSDRSEIPYTPAFHPDTLSYHLALNAYGVVRLSYFNGNEVRDASVLLDGKALFSSDGPNEYLCTLNVADRSRTFSIIVTDYDNHDKTYTVSIEATPSTNDSLKDLRLYDPNGVQMSYSPVFNSDSLAYAVTSPYYGVHRIAASAFDSLATIKATIDGREINRVWIGSREVYPCTVTTTAKTRTCSIAVTAADGITKRFYAVTFRRAPALTGMSTLADAANSLNPRFSPYTYTYEFVMPICVDTLTLVPTCASGDEIRINGSILLSGSTVRLPILRSAETTAVELAVREKNTTDTTRYVIKVTWDGWSRADTITGFSAGTSVRTAGQKVYFPVSDGSIRRLMAFDGASVVTACTLSTISSNYSNLFAIDSGHIFYFGTYLSRNVLFRHRAASWDTASDTLAGDLTPVDMVFDAQHRLHVLCSANNSSGLRVKRLSGGTWVDEGNVPNSEYATSPVIGCRAGTIFVNFRNQSGSGIVDSLSGSGWKISDYTDITVNKQVLAGDSTSLFWGFSQDTAVVKRYSGSSWNEVYNDTTIKNIGALAVDGGAPWLLGVGPLRVLKLSGSRWEQVGMSDFLGGLSPAFMAVLRGQPYVGYLKGTSELVILTYQE